ncbi:MAG: hypothetical protein IPN86_11465 [Saprospiraceae bacterium]|nr:hypothetical protein [Saprospiraceae bacterium]
MNNIFNSDFQEFLKAFEDFQVEYVLVGGYSVIIHGYSRTTGDMDLFVNPHKDNYNKVVKAFAQFGMPLFGMDLENFLDTDNFDVFEYGRPPMAIDIITKLKGVNFFDAYKNAIRYEVTDTLCINVIHISQLIRNKMAVGRLKDLSDIDYLNEK